MYRIYIYMYVCRYRCIYIYIEIYLGSIDAHKLCSKSCLTLGKDTWLTETLTSPTGRWMDWNIQPLDGVPRWFSEVFLCVFLGGRKPFIAETSWLDSATFLKGFVMFFFLKHARIQNLWLLFGLRQAHRATQDPPLLNDLPSELVHVMAVGFPVLACKLLNLPFLRVKFWTCFDCIAMNDILKLPTNISVLDQFPCYSFSRFGSDDWNMF